MAHLQTDGAKLSVRKTTSKLPWLLGLLAIPFVFVLLLTAAGEVPALAAFVAAAIYGTIAAVAAPRMKKSAGKKPMFQLRGGTAALPASDSLVARLAALYQASAAEDVRDRLGHLALTVQQLVDHRATLPEVERKEVDVVTEPIEALVGLLEAEVRRVADLDAAMSELDEGALVRALASAQATGADPEAHLDGLHRLRDLEQSRAAALHRLLEASTLLRRAAELGLRVKDEGAQHDREIQRALAVLGGS